MMHALLFEGRLCRAVMDGTELTVKMISPVGGNEEHKYKNCHFEIKPSIDAVQEVNNLDREIEAKKAELEKLNKLLAPKLYEGMTKEEKEHEDWVRMRYDTGGGATNRETGLLLRQLDSIRKYAAWLEQETGQSEAYDRGHRKGFVQAIDELVKRLHTRIEGLSEQQYSIRLECTAILGWCRHILCEQGYEDKITGEWSAEDILKREA